MNIIGIFLGQNVSVHTLVIPFCFASVFLCAFSSSLFWITNCVSAIFIVKSNVIFHFFGLVSSFNVDKMFYLFVGEIMIEISTFCPSSLPSVNENGFHLKLKLEVWSQRLLWSFLFNIFCYQINESGKNTTKGKWPILSLFCPIHLTCLFCLESRGVKRRHRNNIDDLLAPCWDWVHAHIWLVHLASNSTVSIEISLNDCISFACIVLFSFFLSSRSLFLC